MHRDAPMQRERVHPLTQKQLQKVQLAINKQRAEQRETAQHILLRKGRGGTMFMIACIGMKKS